MKAANTALVDLTWDTLLRELKERGVYLQAFADDVLLVFHGGTAAEIERQANAALDHAQRWGDVSNSPQPKPMLKRIV